MISAWKSLPEAQCPECKQQSCLEHRTRESSDGAYTDDEYRCSFCGKRWIIDGIDS